MKQKRNLIKTTILVISFLIVVIAMSPWSSLPTIKYFSNENTGTRIIESARGTFVYERASQSTIFYSFDENSGTLIIKGTGEIRDYDWYVEEEYMTLPPWHDLRDNIKRIEISEGITTIGANSFYRCVNLTSVSLPNGLKKIHAGAFEQCENLENITLPESVNCIGAWSFGNCSSLTSITLPDSVNFIGRRSFYNCKSLKELKLPNNIWIEENAFEGCVNLKLIYQVK